MYVYMYVCMYESVRVCEYDYIGVYVRVYACMYSCMYV